MSEPLTTYHGTDRANHWIVAISIIGLLIAGWVLHFEALPRETAGEVRNFHKAFGTLILIFGLWRVGYRLLRGFPAPAAAMAGWQDKLSRIVHYLLLALIAIMPASGVCKSLFAGYPINIFGLFVIGTPDNKNEALAQLASAVHFLAGVAITLILVLHIAAALKHHFVDRDATLMRMLRG